MNCYSPSLPQTVLKIQNVQFIIRISYPRAHCVKIFQWQTGIYLHEIGCEGSNDGQFYCPCGLAIDKYNRLIVCDVDKKRLQLFALRGKFLSKLQGEYFHKGRPYYVAVNNNDNNLFV